MSETGLLDEAKTQKLTDQFGSGSFREFENGHDRRIWALTARQAQRLNAASVSQHELNDLLKERQNLLDRKFSQTMSDADAIRLEYVQWSLDRIEDAQTGGLLDLLENKILQFEDLVESIRDLQQQIDHLSKKKK